MLKTADVAIPFSRSRAIPIWQFLADVDGIFIQDQHYYNLFDQGKIMPRARDKEDCPDAPCIGRVDV